MDGWTAEMVTFGPRDKSHTSFHLLCSTATRHHRQRELSVWVSREQQNFRNGFGWNDRGGQKRKEKNVLEAWDKLAFLSNLISQMVIAHLPDCD